MLRRPAQQIELIARPNVLILYTDDCEEHTQSVIALKNLLTQAANSRILLDQIDLQDSSKFFNSRKVLNIFSIKIIFRHCSKYLAFKYDI